MKRATDGGEKVRQKDKSRCIRGKDGRMRFWKKAKSRGKKDKREESGARGWEKIETKGKMWKKWN
jgi:hypothetical protein